MELENAYKRIMDGNIFNQDVKIVFPKGNDLSVDGKLIKGKFGQFLEKWLGINPGTEELDFEDGDLKTYHSEPGYYPIETIKICKLERKHKDQYHVLIDDYIDDNPKDFSSTWLYHKISNDLLVPRVGSGVTAQFINCFHFKCEVGSEIFQQLQSDYIDICNQMKEFVTGKYVTKNRPGQLHTFNGKYLQIRTAAQNSKTGKIYSPKLSREVSHCDFAFYFQKRFVIDICRGKILLEKCAEPIKRDWEQPNYATRRLALEVNVTQRY